MDGVITEDLKATVWKFVKMEKKEESCCLNWENQHVELVQQKLRKSGLKISNMNYSDKNNIFNLFPPGLNILIMWFIHKSGEESVSGWGGRQENAKKRETRYIN